MKKMNRYLRALTKRWLGRLRATGDPLTGGGLRSLAKRVVSKSIARAMGIPFLKRMGRAVQQPFFSLLARINAPEAEGMCRASVEELGAGAVGQTGQAGSGLAITVSASDARMPANRIEQLRGNFRVLYISGEPDTQANLYRVVRQVEAANAAGARASWIPWDEVTVRSEDIAVADIIVMWRTAWDERVAAIVEAARQGGARVVCDVDCFLVDSEIALGKIAADICTNGLTDPQVGDHLARLRSTMLAADYCTAPTEELAGHVRRFFHPAMVLPDGFDHATYKLSRRAVRRRRSQKPDGLVRIGFAGGSPTGQGDFAVAAKAVARLLRERPYSRLVLFRSADASVPTLDIKQFPALQEIEDRIEWQSDVPLPHLPEGIVHLDVNLAPVEAGKAFCDAQSELKFFEAALVDVPTIASATGPLRRTIRHGVTGFLADSSEDWYSALLPLTDDPDLRHRVARAAHRTVLWRYGPLRRTDAMLSALPQLHGNSRDATRAFAFDLHRGTASTLSDVSLADAETVFEADEFGDADLTVVIPLHNYAQYIEEALESVRAQTLEMLDLIVVDDASTDSSISIVVGWAERNAKRFNRTLVLRHKTNAGLGTTRNTGVDAADTPFVLLLDADNRLRPECGAVCLSVARESGAAFVYPLLQQFGEKSNLMGNCPFEPGRFIGGNYIDALALVSKEAWAAVGGYGVFRVMGWEDFDFWCRLVEHGLWGCRAGEIPLAEYRVHGNSMLRTTTTIDRNYRRLVAEMEHRYPWLDLIDPSPPTTSAISSVADSPAL
jgi:GT2 family glycosyltransferase/glycosyltransferase involved in cell wall biosynthesis